MLSPPQTSQTAGSAASGQTRYVVLDALRGVAAIAVVIFHAVAFGFAPNMLPHGYLHVDFFFILSGFVIAHAYEAKLATSMSFNDFVFRRIVRLYPLALLGLGLGTALMLVKAAFFPEVAVPAIEVIWASLSNIFLLPDFFSNAAPAGELFPANGPLWSLFLELAINILWAAFAISLRLRSLIVMLVMFGLAYAIGILSLGNAEVGAVRDSMLVGCFRACFGFTAGVVLYRLRDRWVLPNLHWGIIAAVLVLVTSPVLTSYLVLWDLAVVLIVLPLLVGIAGQQVADNRLARFLGDLSYPIYVLHWPFFVLVSGVYQLTGLSLHPYLVGAITFVALVGVCYAALKLYDEPVRKYLSQRGKAWFG